MTSGRQLTWEAGLLADGVEVSRNTQALAFETLSVVRGAGIAA